ncbi:MAG: efflux RND transporter permease subunit [Longimicrobiales bacterium]
MREPGAEPSGGEGSRASKPRFFGPTNLAVRNRTSILALLLIVTVIGLAAYNVIPKESSPEITIPMISVHTIYPGVSPQDMETLVTRVLEDELHQVPEIIELTSVSDMGYSNVIAEFDSDMDMDVAFQKVRDKVDLAKPELPTDVEDPVISEFNFADFPIMQVNVAGEYDLVRLKEVAEDLQDRLEQIPQLLEVRLSGGLEREVKVDVDLTKLQFYDIAFTDVIDAIREENVTIPGGSIEVGSQDYLVRVAGEFEDTRIIEDIVIVSRDARPIYVRDVATVDFGFVDRNSYARLDGNTVVTLDIVKRSGENVIETSEAVRAAIAALEPTFPPSTVVKVTGDQSEEIRVMVASLENNIISGLILVVAVLLFFLGVRNASFVGISIPTSMLLSFIVLQAAGVSMNMVVLFSLILALGMLVDNAIVVVENIYRHMEQGYDGFEAAMRATGEVAMPVISSTLTTVAAFFPLMFWPGIVGEFMSYLPMTLIVTLSSSLFVALIIVPTLCAMFMRLDHVPGPGLRPTARWVGLGAGALGLLIIAASSVLAAVLVGVTVVGLVALHRVVLARLARWFQDRAVPAITGFYVARLRWALRHRVIVLAGCVVTFIGGIAIFGVLGPGVEFFPESIPPATVIARVDVPSGTSPEFTNRLAEQIEEQIRTIPGFGDSESMVATVSASGEGNAFFGGGGEGNVSVNFIDFDEREFDTFETLRDLQQRVGDGLAGAEFKVEAMQGGPPTGAPVNLEIVGPDVDQLKALSDQVLAILKGAPVYNRLEGLESDMTRGRPELVVEVDRETAALFDLNTSEIGTTVRTAIQGTEAAKYRYGKDEYDIVVRLAEPYRSNLDALEDLTVMAEEQQIPLLSVANWWVDEGLGTVRRKDLDRVATISSDVGSGENSNAVLAEVSGTLVEFQESLPPGYTMRYTGEQEDQQEAMAFLSSAFLIALMLIALILTSQFNSVLKPLIIMSSVIMSTVGVLLGWVVFQMPFGIIMTGVGVISLAGIVVNNSIVLIDYIDLLQKRDGLPRDEALILAGQTRFRPVILTAITTVFGLVPLAIGFNIDFAGLYTSLNPNIFWGGEQAAWWAPMAIAVIAGLTFATVLTLIVAPVLYSVVDDMGQFFRRNLMATARADQAAVSPEGLPAALPEHRPRSPRRRRFAAALAARFQGSRLEPGLGIDD